MTKQEVKRTKKTFISSKEAWILGPYPFAESASRLEKFMIVSDEHYEGETEIDKIIGECSRTRHDIAPLITLLPSKENTQVKMDNWHVDFQREIHGIPSWSKYKTKTDKLIINVADTVFSIPGRLKELGDAIEKAKYMLGYKDNWDGEGSAGYKENTFLKTIKFLIELAKDVPAIFPTPNIYHGPNGSIDIYWKEENMNLLINVLENNDTATFYGEIDDYYREGNFNIVDPDNTTFPCLKFLLGQ